MKNEKTKNCAANIDNKGRIFRAGGAVVFGLAAMFSWSRSITLGAGLTLASAFLAFEATRGWCALRAGGVKTKF